jgi:hypothetical protein
MINIVTTAYAAWERTMNQGVTFLASNDFKVGTLSKLIVPANLMKAIGYSCDTSARPFVRPWPVKL